MTRNALFLSSLLLLSLTASPVSAQEKTKEAPQKTESAAPAKTPEKAPVKTTQKPAEKTKSVVKLESKPGEPTGALKKWIDAENALIEPLNAKDQESFFILRSKYSIIRAIGVVERGIDRAVQSCGKANPDMKARMEQRFKQWTNAVDPIIATAQKQFDKDLEAQKIVDVKKARDVFKLNDAAYEEGDSQTAKTPVSSPDACEDLIDNMDETEDNMIKLLQQTLLPESAVRQRDAEAKKAEARKKASQQTSEPQPKKE